MSYWRPSGAGGPLIRPAGPAPRARRARSAGPPSPLRGPAEPASRARWPAPRAREARAAGLRGPLRGPAGPRINSHATRGTRK